MKYLYKIYNIEIDSGYKKHFSYLEKLSLDFDYLEVLPSHKKENYLKYLDKIDKKINHIDKDFNFLNMLQSYNILFNKLEKPKINKIAYKALTSIEVNKSILNNLRKFKPCQGFSEKIDYCLSSNITGRLNIKRGPNILVLPSRCRSIFESRHTKGSLLSIDFNNLEPRLFLKLCDNDIEDKDIYSYFANLTNENIDRSIIKKAVISRLYGSSMNYLEKNISNEKIDKIKLVIEEYFDIKKIEELSDNVYQNLRYNYFGRPIRNSSASKKNIIVNNYIQSSAVDVALNYFYELTTKLDLKKAIPLFIIHDAFIFDVEQSYIEEFSDYIKKGCNIPKLGQFPVSIDSFV